MFPTLSLIRRIQAASWSSWTLPDLKSLFVFLFSAQIYLTRFNWSKEVPFNTPEEDLCCCFVGNRVSYSPGWPQTHCVTKNDLVLLVLLPVLGL